MVAVMMKTMKMTTMVRGRPWRMKATKRETQAGQMPWPRCWQWERTLKRPLGCCPRRSKKKRTGLYRKEYAESLAEKCRKNIDQDCNQGGGAVVQCGEGAAEGHEEPAEASWWQFQKTGEGVEDNQQGKFYQHAGWKGNCGGGRACREEKQAGE